MNSPQPARPIELVYILGNSFSGSTFLGFLVAATPDVLYLGELKMHNRETRSACTCGAPARECPFWSPWDARGYRLYSGSLRDKLSLGARLLLGLPLRRLPLPSDDQRFLREMQAASAPARYLLDGSKSVWRLAHLAALPEVRLSVIHVRRSLHGNVGSFMKRRGWFWPSLGGCLLNNLLCERILARHPELRRLQVQYEALCEDPDAAMRAIAAFLAIDYSGYQDYLASATHHVRAGNGRTIQQAQEGLRIRRSEEDWRARFGPFRAALLNVLARRTNRPGDAWRTT